MTQDLKIANAFFMCIKNTNLSHKIYKLLLLSHSLLRLSVNSKKIYEATKVLILDYMIDHHPYVLLLTPP